MICSTVSWITRSMGENQGQSDSLLLT